MIAGTPLETYLRRRGCAVPTGIDVRYDAQAWHWKASVRAPAMLARVTDFITSEPLTVHLTFIDDAGGKSSLLPRKLLLAGHEKQGGVIRLTDDADVTHVLGITEGIETALSIALLPQAPPTWATVDAGNLASLPVVPGIETLWIFADNDPAGVRAANACATRWREAGREVRIATPREPGADWNDVA